MKRLLDFHLKRWKTSPLRKPLILYGARQVGKTHAVREFGKSFPLFIEINFEIYPEFREVFEKDLDPHRITQAIFARIKQPIIPGQTLLFFDEVQIAPQAIIALRYFYEMMPELHVIAAGSLLQFAIEQVGMPVGRVQSISVYPVSFMEYLAATNEKILLQKILTHAPETVMDQFFHTRILELLSEYLAFGGMPAVLTWWLQTKNPVQSSSLHHTILQTYKQDFNKYAKKHQVKYLDLLFAEVPRQLGSKFQFNEVPGEFRKRELAPAIDLLVKAGIVYKAYHSAGQGIPIGAQVNFDDFKALFLDVGLAQAIQHFDFGEWFINPLTQFINKGALIESFVGQEILAYSDPLRLKNLYYWHREERSSQAEIDYLIQKEQYLIPIEVKSGASSSLKSLHLFLQSHQNSPYGIKFSTQNYSIYENIHSYPLYAIAAVIAQQEALEALYALSNGDI